MVQREKAEAKSHPMKKAVRRVQGAPSMIKGGGKKIGRKRGGGVVGTKNRFDS